MATLEGFADLERKLKELASPQQNYNALRAAVRAGMKGARQRAKANISAISPGKTELHKTYKGRLVSAGFAARSINLVVKANKAKTSVSALLGVRKEAFYAVQFFELGTAHIPRRPWLVPALEASRGEAINAIRETLKKRIDRIAKQKTAGAR